MKTPNPPKLCMQQSVVVHFNYDKYEKNKQTLAHWPVP